MRLVSITFLKAFLKCDVPMKRLLLRNSGQGCTIVHFDTKNLVKKIPKESDRVAPSKGIYDWNHIKWRDAWPKKDTAKEAITWSVDAWQSRGEDAAQWSQFHLAQWLISVEFGQSTFGASLETLALHYMNPYLYGQGLNNMSPESVLDGIMVDYMTMYQINEQKEGDLNHDLYTFAVGMNLYTVNEKCGINENKSLLLPGAKTKRSLGGLNPLVTDWNGVIYANGTRDDTAQS